MSRKPFVNLIVLILILTASFALTGNAYAWSTCGNSYVVQWGDTMAGIAAYCGTTVSALYAANPWTTGYLYAGQVLAIPDGYQCYCCNCPQDGYSGYTGTYTVQWGDTFAKIAQRYGVSVNSLWAANPYIWNINRIYPGQVLKVPSSGNTSGSSDSSWFEIVSTDYDPLVERSYGTVPEGTPTGKVKLVNSASADVYVSLQGTTADGAEVIREYPVDGSMNVNVPNGWYIYVAWVGGEKYSGQFKLGGNSNPTLVFYSNKVVLK
jgi:LysM repeat protein